MKLKDIEHYNKYTGEIIEKEKVDEIRKIEWKHKQNRIKTLIEKSPEKLSLEELKEYYLANNINFNTIKGFDKYHRINHKLDLVLMDEYKLSQSAYYYFNKIICKYCSNTYSILYNNNRPINNDEKLSKALDISLSYWKKIKKELIKYNLIKKSNLDNKIIYKINPCFVGLSRTITPSTYNAFRDDMIKYELINKYQQIYWDKLLLEEYGRE